MCVTLALAATSVALAGVGAYASIQSANGQRDAERFRLETESRRLREQGEMERIAAAQQEAAKSDEFMASRSAALAAIGASGIGDHISFFQAIDPESKRAFARDVQSIRLNLAQDENDISTQIRVNDFGKQMASFNARMSKVGAVLDFAQTAMNAVSFYSQMATGSPGAGAPATAGGPSSSSAFRSGSTFFGTVR